MRLFLPQLISFVLAAACFGAEPGVFPEYQTLLKEKRFTATDHGNSLAEYVEANRSSGVITFDQRLSADGLSGVVITEFHWAIDDAVFAATHATATTFEDGMVKVSIVATTSRAFRYSCKTEMRTADGRRSVNRNSGDADRLGISFQDKAAADKFIALHAKLVAELGRGK